ncbi:hypothetical protein T552_03089 [Pneumocystis carinii B80]|uniref:non-specific serine/threonine protein kinase n=1 Tax=Pneumocystis carinii (strain B80) TaxID=1408658 RepID=A0A0W4ZD08_PNEC8|nr:hypothetical protein T552_03089 [Pneumocystis carinii B80]KTW26197.1 hypothetical protein T552_03089 [Pneumocystis carinii B80]
MSWKLSKKFKNSTQGISPNRESSGHMNSDNANPNPNANSDANSNANSNAQKPLQDQEYVVRPGILSVTVVEAENLSLPPGISLPESSSAERHYTINGRKGSKDRSLFFPYLVVEFDKNQTLVDALDGSSTICHPRWEYKINFDVLKPSQLSIQCYLRLGQMQKGHGSGNHIYLGGIKFIPNFSETSLKDEWMSMHGGTGQIRLQVSYKSNKSSPITIDSFKLLKVVGRGSFGKVMQVRKIDTSCIYALKTIRKAHIVSRSEINHTLAERTVLAQINNPFIVPLKFSFQSPEKLYLVLAFVNGGELFYHLQREGRFDLERSRFYAAELLCALECLHNFNVIYRDLKPENILLDYIGHIALCDFGLCKLNIAESEKTNTFCGTPEYLAPELLLGQGYTKVVDWWTLGVLLYEMLTGLPPFYNENTNEMYRRILQDPLRFPDDIDKEARSLLAGLLTRNPEKRLGNLGAAEIKSHPFFSSIDWKKLYTKKIQPPFKPNVENVCDTSNFDQEFTNETPIDSVADDSHLSETIQRKFQDWSYHGSNVIDSCNNNIISEGLENIVE